jgi:hypothetical protein
MRRACRAGSGQPGPVRRVDAVFETDAGDGFRESGFSKERRLEPQITIGLLTDSAGFPLMVSAFAGNAAETTTMLPVIREFMTAHYLSDVTVVADAGMISAANQKAIEAEGGCRSSSGPASPTSPGSSPSGGASTRARRSRTGISSPSPGRPARPTSGGTRSTTTSTGTTGPAHAAWHRRADRQGRKGRGREDPGQTEPVRPVVRRHPEGQPALEETARAIAGLKGYVTNLAACPDGTQVTPDFVIGAYHQLSQIERSFRMSKHDLQARPAYHHKRDSIEAHLTIVFAALAVSRWIEDRTGWSIRKFVRTTRRYRAIAIQARHHVITAADPLPEDLHEALDRVHQDSGAH